jgi:hypothetical protein
MKPQKRCHTCGKTFAARPYARHCSERCRKSEGDDVAALRLATKRRMRDRMKALKSVKTAGPLSPYLRPQKRSKRGSE